eukprot:TRINITY_DN8237_c2_g1_i1.p1 TRINITY_DN8237_c2_g1~~TRINITY_DN8237_c2_g1_i1.p1  ORF type:complete len:362 (-),score=27.45 TRINITY_DN8237_c2_g1_i1:282-1367(-)
MNIVMVLLTIVVLLVDQLVAQEGCSCSDTPPPDGTTCLQIDCDKPWMKTGSYCEATCARCSCTPTQNISSQIPHQITPNSTQSTSQYILSLVPNFYASVRNDTDTGDYDDVDDFDFSTQGVSVWQILLGVFWLWGILFWVFMLFRICRYRMTPYQRFGIGCLALFYIPFLIIAPMEFFFRGTPISVPFALIWIAFSSYHYYFFSVWFLRVRVLQTDNQPFEQQIGDIVIQVPRESINVARVVSIREQLLQEERERQIAMDANRIMQSLQQASLQDCEKQGNCGICLDELLDRNTGSNQNVNGDSVQLPCQHVFHGICIKRWIQVKGGRVACPLCGTPIYYRQTQPAELQQQQQLQQQQFFP